MTAARRRPRLPLALAVLGVLAGAAGAQPPDPAAGADAAAAARGWLALVDGGRYAESLAAGGALFRAHLTPEAWTRQAAAAREPMGALRAREVLDETAARTLPGAPDGDWRVVRFRSAFARKADAVETVVLLREGAGWRVDGYFIR